MPWRQPINEIRDYFGEKVALYFHFLGHYTTWLLYLAIAGVVVCFDVSVESGNGGSLAYGLGNAKLIPVFGFFVSFWSILMLEYWKRKEVTCAMEWGMSNFESSMELRKHFIGKEIHSPINGKPMRYFSNEARNFRELVSGVIITLMIMLVAALVSLLFYIRLLMYLSPDPTVSGMSGTVTSIVSAVQIQVLNELYGGIADWRTKAENHRTDTEFEDSLIMKLFLFQFINSYASLFYIAFVKAHIGDTCVFTCMAELAQSLTIIFITQIVVGNAQELLGPIIDSWLKKRAELAKANKEADERIKASKALVSGGAGGAGINMSSMAAGRMSAEQRRLKQLEREREMISVKEIVLSAAEEEFTMSPYDQVLSYMTLTLTLNIVIRTRTLTLTFNTITSDDGNSGRLFGALDSGFQQ